MLDSLVQFDQIKKGDSVPREVQDFYVEHRVEEYGVHLLSGIRDPYLVAQDLSEVSLCVGKIDGQVIGITTYREDVGDFGLILVHPDFREQGLWRQLWNKVLDILTKSHHTISVQIGSEEGERLIHKLKKAFSHILFDIV